MKYISTLLFVLASLVASAQITTGAITYDIEMGELEGEMAAAAAFMQDMKMTISFKPGMSVTEMDMMGFIKTKTFQEGTSTTQYMDMMGQKIKIVSDLEDVQEMMGAEGEELMKKMEDIYKKSEVKGATKEILGYTCQKVEIDMNIADMIPDGEEVPEEVGDMKMVLYTTDQIKMDNVELQMMKNLKFEGAPLQMVMDMGMMKMTMTATNVSKEVDPSVWNAPEGNYKEMTPEELQNMGMNMEGFGF